MRCWSCSIPVEGNISSHNITLDPYAAPTAKVSIDGWLTFSITVSIGGSLLLVLLLVTSFYHEKLHTGSRILIIHLMVMHLLICAIYYPLLNISSYMVLRGQIISIHCQPILLLHNGTMHAQNWASLVLAINRYTAITLPHCYKKLVTTKALIVMIVLPWLIGIGDTMPVYFGVGGDFILAPPYGCVFQTNDGIYGTVWATIGGYVPIALMGIIYVTLFLQLAIARYHANRSVTNPITAQLSSSIPVSKSRTTRTRQMSMVKMLVASFVWYCLCFIPGPLIVTEFPFLYAEHFMLRLWVLSIMLCGFAASPVSPIP